MPLKLEMVTPFGAKLDVMVDDIVIPTAMGEIGILPGHASLMAQVRIGEFRIVQSDKIRRFAVGNGFVEVIEDVVKIVVESCEEDAEIDIERARKAESRASETLKNLPEATDDKPDERPKYIESLEKAMNRIKIAEKRKE